MSAIRESDIVAYNQLKTNLIGFLMGNQYTDVDKPYLSAKCPNATLWTRRSLAEGIERNDPEALDILTGLVNLAADLVHREEQELKQ